VAQSDLERFLIEAHAWHAGDPSARDPHKFLITFNLVVRCFLWQTVFVLARNGDAGRDVNCSG
jgi:hypothetical protein